MHQSNMLIHFYKIWMSDTVSEYPNESHALVPGRSFGHRNRWRRHTKLSSHGIVAAKNGWQLANVFFLQSHHVQSWLQLVMLMCCRFCLSIAAFAFFGVYPWFPCWQRTYPAYHVTMLELATIGSKLVQSTATHDWQTEAGYHDIPFQNMPQTPKRYWSHQDLYWIPNMPVALHFFNVWPRTFHSCLLAGRRSLTMPQSRHRRTKQNMLV